MPDFTVTFGLPAIDGAFLTAIVESDDAISAVNAGAAQIILAAKRQGSDMRPEELYAITVFEGRHVNMLGVDG